MPWSLSAGTEGAIEMVYWGGITAPQPRPQDSVLVLTRVMNHSELMVTLSPGQYEFELILPWEWELTTLQCGNGKTVRCRERKGFSTENKSSAGL